MALSRRAFVRTAGVAGASALVSLRSGAILARGREAAVGEGRDFEPLPETNGAGPIRLSSNENPIGPPPWAVDALMAAFAAEAPRYPGGPTQRVAERIAAHHSVPVE